MENFNGNHVGNSGGTLKKLQKNPAEAVDNGTGAIKGNLEYISEEIPGLFS